MKIFAFERYDTNQHNSIFQFHGKKPFFFSFVMTLEDVWFDTRPTLIDALYYLDRVLTVVFFLETTLKLFAMGFVMYFTNAWCWLDFVIVAVSIVNFAASLMGFGNIAIFKTMRTLRALRPLRAMAKMEGKMGCFFREINFTENFVKLILRIIPSDVTGF